MASAVRPRTASIALLLLATGADAFSTAPKLIGFHPKAATCSSTITCARPAVPASAVRFNAENLLLRDSSNSTKPLLSGLLRTAAFPVLLFAGAAVGASAGAALMAAPALPVALSKTLAQVKAAAVTDLRILGSFLAPLPSAAAEFIVSLATGLASAVVLALKAFASLGAGASAQLPQLSGGAVAIVTAVAGACSTALSAVWQYVKLWPAAWAAMIAAIGGALAPIGAWTKGLVGGAPEASAALSLAAARIAAFLAAIVTAITTAGRSTAATLVSWIGQGAPAGPEQIVTAKPIGVAAAGAGSAAATKAAGAYQAAGGTAGGALKAASQAVGQAVDGAVASVTASVASVTASVASASAALPPGAALLPGRLARLALVVGAFVGSFMLVFSVMRYIGETLTIWWVYWRRGALGGPNEPIMQASRGGIVGAIEWLLAWAQREEERATQFRQGALPPDVVQRSQLMRPSYSPPEPPPPPRVQAGQQQFRYAPRGWPQQAPIYAEPPPPPPPPPPAPRWQRQPRSAQQQPPAAQQDPKVATWIEQWGLAKEASRKRGGM